jgi:AcrR family transcriptional regulator
MQARRGGGVVTMRPRGTRARPAKPPLGLDVVVQAGLDVLRAEGLEAVTMRRVASALDTGPASLYVYVAGREDLLTAMLDAVYGEVPRPVPPAHDWRSTLLDLLQAIKRALDDHPGIALAALGVVPAGPNALALTELALELLAQGGVTGRRAVWACQVLALHVAGSSSETSLRRASGAGEAQRAAAWRAADPDGLPLLTPLAPLFRVGDEADRFTFGLELLLDGLTSRA